MSVGSNNSRQDIPHLGFVVDQLQKRFTLCTTLANSEYVFGGRVQADNQQVFVEKNYARTQGVENRLGVLTDGSIIIGTATAPLSGFF